MRFFSHSVAFRPFRVSHWLIALGGSTGRVPSKTFATIMANVALCSGAVFARFFGFD
jgi:hypothetical protein